MSAIGRFYRPAALARTVVSTGLALLATASATAQSPDPRALEHPPLGSTITVDAFSLLPATGNLFPLLDTVSPDVIADRIDTGGLSAGEPARVGAHGSTWTQTRFTLGDIDITDPGGTGTPLLLPGVDTWTRVDVTSGMMPLDRPAPGLSIGLVPRTAGEEWTGALTVIGAPTGIEAHGDAGNRPSIARLSSWLHGNLLVAGPLVPSKIGIFASGGATRSAHFERSGTAAIDSDLASAFVNITAKPAPTDDVRAIGWFQRSRNPVAGHAALGLPNAGEQRTAFHGQVSWGRELAARDGGMRAFGGFTTRRRAEQFTAPDFVIVERLRDGPIPNLLDAGPGDDRAWSAGVRVHGAFVPGGLAGKGAGRVNAIAGIDVNGDSTNTQSAFAGVVGELIDGIPARLWQFTDPPAASRWRSLTASGFVGATAAIAPRMTLDGGLRVQSIRGSRAGEDASISWRSLDPRAGARLLLWPAYDLVAFGHYGRYSYRLPLPDLAYGDPSAPTATLWQWNAPVGATSLDPRTIGPFFQRVGPGTHGDPAFSAIDPGLEQPYLHEVVLGFEGRPNKSAFMRLSAIGRREHRLIGAVDTTVPASSYTTINVFDTGVDLIGERDDQILAFYNRNPASFGADRYLLTNPVGDDTWFVGADLSIQVRVRRWYSLAGITAGRSHGISGNRGFGPLENDASVLGDVFIDPNSRTFAEGRLFTERGYTIKTAQGFQFDHDLDVGLIGRYQDGQHFARLVVVSGLNQGAEAIRAFPNGKTRFTFSSTFDARVQKGFRLGSKARLTAILDAYNLLNLALEVEEFVVTGPTSRLTSAVQPPRVIQIGARIGF